MVSSTIFGVFGITRLGKEPQFPEPYTLPIRKIKVWNPILVEILKLSHDFFRLWYDTTWDGPVANTVATMVPALVITYVYIYIYMHKLAD